MPETTATPAFDPYEPRPTFLQRHGDRVAAVAVFVLTIVLTVAAFPPFKSPELAYAMLVPGVYWAYTRPQFKLFAWTMLAAQAVAWTILLGWLHNVTWVGLFLLGPFVGCWVGSWYLVAAWTMPRMLGRPTLTRFAAMIGLAGAWVLIEWTRTWLLGGFPWLPLAASQWTMVSMLQIAAYTGAYGISFVVVIVNLGFAAYAHRLFREGATGLNKRSQEFFLSLFVVLACFSLHVQQTFNRAPFAKPFAKIAVVQPYIPQVEKWDPKMMGDIFLVLEKQTMDAAAMRPDLILWPEASTPLAMKGDAQARQWVEALVKRAGVPLLLGSIAVENRDQPSEKWFNATFLVTPEGGMRDDYYAKRQLVPFGEFIPLRPVLGWLTKFVPIGGDFARGKSPAPMLVPIRNESIVFGPLICYEDVYPDLARDSVLAGAGVLTVLTNNGWFGEGGAAYQHAAHSVLRAVENRRPVLRCGNGGWSGWIDEFGAIRNVAVDADDRIYFRGMRSFAVTRDSRWIDQTTFYSDHGDWFVLVCFALAGFGGMVLWTARMVKPIKPRADGV
jgi:apolipoprotein N-acyltransferase